MSALIRVLYPLPAPERTATALLKWWERRRLPFNLAVGAAGLTSLAVVNLLGALPPNGRSFGVPLGGIIAYAVLANLCFTGGWVVETAVARLWRDQVRPQGPVLFRQGMIFGVGLSLLPVVLAGVEWVVRVIGAILR